MKGLICFSIFFFKRRYLVKKCKVAKTRLHLKRTGEAEAKAVLVVLRLADVTMTLGWPRSAASRHGGRATVAVTRLLKLSPFSTPRQKKLKPSPEKGSTKQQVCSAANKLHLLTMHNSQEEHTRCLRNPSSWDSFNYAWSVWLQNEKPF